MKKGLITDIQRFSLNDGPGIRTTVFFKGCNMKCSWCHHPETISHTKEIMFYPSKCIDCGICFETCQFKAHRLENGAHIISLGSRILRAETAAITAIGMGMLYVEMNLDGETK